MTNAGSWFEIPVSNYNRAKTFYATVLDAEVTDMPMGDVKYGVFPHNPESHGIGGGIVEMHDFKPSQEGTMVYLNGGEDLSTPLARIETAGGKIIMPKTAIGENGFMAHFIDTEGNKVALHSMN